MLFKEMPPVEFFRYHLPRHCQQAACASAHSRSSVILAGDLLYHTADLWPEAQVGGGDDHHQQLTGHASPHGLKARLQQRGKHVLQKTYRLQQAAVADGSRVASAAQAEGQQLWHAVSTDARRLGGAVQVCFCRCSSCRALGQWKTVPMLTQFYK